MTDTVLVEGRSREKAAELLAKAREQGIPLSEVKTTLKGYIVPTSLVDGGKPVERSTEQENTDVFDPADHNVDEVEEYLATADASERERVLDAERKGKARKRLLALTDSEGEK